MRCKPRHIRWKSEQIAKIKIKNQTQNHTDFRKIEQTKTTYHYLPSDIRIAFVHVGEQMMACHVLILPDEKIGAVEKVVRQRPDQLPHRRRVWRCAKNRQVFNCFFRNNTAEMIIMHYTCGSLHVHRWDTTMQQTNRAAMSQVSRERCCQY